MARNNEPEEENVFARLMRDAISEDRTCQKCGREFHATQKEEWQCSECKYYETHPEMAKGYWTWTQLGDKWGISAYWSQHGEAENELPGTTVTVHRKNGTTSQATITQVRGGSFNRSAEYRVYCYVK